MQLGQSIHIHTSAPLPFGGSLDLLFVRGGPLRGSPLCGERLHGAPARRRVRGAPVGGGLLLGCSPGCGGARRCRGGVFAACLGLGAPVSGGSLWLPRALRSPPGVSFYD